MTIPSWCRVGAKVVCVDSQSVDGGAFHLTKGRVYQVVSINDPYVRVADDRGKVGGWHISHFRPLVTEKDDIATHFEQYLKTDHRATRRVGEDA